MNQQDNIESPVLKVFSMWAAIGITSWAEFASFLAAIYTMFLMGEWLWKKLFKPIAVRHGWIEAPRNYVGGDDEQ
ncbi:hypothetical protein [Aquabacterium sp.]|uniref:hypothetical protein n=1 Tax=Aquabacterium sp. TaxID=1872578 RepID=UPI0025BCA2FB|nr:hypothetical protein [Aquabacterium sp.]